MTLLLVIARATIQETFRGDVLPAAGATAAPAAPGVTTSLTLDLLCCLPAMLVLLRRLVDRDYALRAEWSQLLMLLLAGWTFLSVLWASDRFLAIVSASHWIAALSLLWAVSQLVRDWTRLRIVAAVGFGVLTVLLAQGCWYRFVDLPDLRHNWSEHRAEMLRSQGVAPDSIEAVQLDKNITSGDVTGFSLSRNTYAAELVLLGMVVAGILLQRRGDGVGWCVIPAAAIAVSPAMLYLCVHSKTAYATPIFGAMLLLAVGIAGRRIAANSRRFYWYGVGLFFLVVLAVVGQGLRHGTLFQLSLTYRWEYWVGAARLFAHHPWLGVGWANFGAPYLRYRLPRAVEEPKDPHNFLIRAFVELGVVGGLLMLGWMMRLWRELTGGEVTAVTVDPVEPERAHRMLLRYALVLPVIAILFSAAIAIDWTQSAAMIFLESFRRGMFLIGMIVAVAATMTRGLDRQEPDDRPALWILRATLIGVGLFLLHNLIDFSMFEPGPMFLFALLTGAAAGMRLPRAERGSERSRAALCAFILAGIFWIVAAAAGVWPVAQAESLARQADDQVRGGNPSAALANLIAAYRLAPINPDYAYRAAMLAGDNPLQARELLCDAIADDPASAIYRRLLAELQLSDGNLQQALDDFFAAVRRDPNNMDLRLEYAAALRRAGRYPAARRQYEKALAENALLPPEEIRRLPAKRVAEIRTALQSLPK